MWYVNQYHPGVLTPGTKIAKVSLLMPLASQLACHPLNEQSVVDSHQKYYCTEWIGTEEALLTALRVLAVYYSS